MSVVSLGILPASADCVLVVAVAVEDAVVAVLDIAGAQVTVEGVTVLVVDPLGVAVCLLVLAAIAGHHLHIVHVRMYHMLMGTVLGTGVGAGVKSIETMKLGYFMRRFHGLCLLCLDFITTMFKWATPLTSTHELDYSLSFNS